ncbi:hypothetical protein HanRHA438_Chr15g0684401 [Helianthus annuus]|nr:hypothetical protein HanRHA438_Chr15g0684401 [Helianthus annuus]
MYFNTKLLKIRMLDLINNKKYMYITCQRIGERRAATGSGGGDGVSSGRT